MRLMLLIKRLAASLGKRLQIAKFSVSAKLKVRKFIALSCQCCNLRVLIFHFCV